MKFEYLIKCFIYQYYYYLEHKIRHSLVSTV